MTPLRPRHQQPARDTPRTGAARRGPLLVGLLLLAATSCRREAEVPEHVAQQQAQKRALEVRLRARQQSAGARDAVVPGESWPPPVQAAYLALLVAPRAEIPAAARRLSELGTRAAPALLELASSPDQHEKKRFLAAVALVELQLARPIELEALALDRRLPFAQRAALESLCQLGRPAAAPSLQRVTDQLRGRSDGPPLLAFLARACKAARPWGYRLDQLAVLDRFLQAQTREEVMIALEWVKDLSLLAGLERLLRVSVIPVPVQAMLAGRLAAAASREEGGLARLFSAEHPPLLRLAVARALLASDRPAALRLVRRAAAQKEDPLAPALQHLLDSPASGPAEGATPAPAR